MLDQTQTLRLIWLIDFAGSVFLVAVVLDLLALVLDFSEAQGR